MNKQELIQAAKEIQDICHRHDYFCTDCPFEGNRCPFDGMPDNWDIERLERIEGELRVKVPVEWLKSAVQANKELERGEDGV